MNEQTQNSDAVQQTEFCYRLLTTIKFRGQVIKPVEPEGTFIQLSDAEAAPLIAKGYISAEQVLPPGTEGDRCESDDPDCGPVVHYDTDGVGLCQRCYDDLAADATSTTELPTTSVATEAVGDQQHQVAGGEAPGADATHAPEAENDGNDAVTGDQASEAAAQVSAEGDAAAKSDTGSTEQPAGGQRAAGGTAAPATKPAKAGKPKK